MSQEIKVQHLSKAQLAQIQTNIVYPLTVYLNDKGITPNEEFINNIIVFYANKGTFDPSLTIFGIKKIADFVAEYFGAGEPVFTDVTKAVMGRIMRQDITEQQYSLLFDDFDSNYYDRIK